MEQTTEWKKVWRLSYILYLYCVNMQLTWSFLVNDSFPRTWYVFQSQELPIWNFDFLQMEAFLRIFNARIGWEKGCWEPDMELGDMH